MAWWKQLLIAGAAFFAGAVSMLVYTQIWFDRFFGPPSQSIQYGRAAQEIGIAVVVLTAAFLMANWIKAKRVIQS